jgi:hypothetical protein
LSGLATRLLEHAGELAARAKGPEHGSWTRAAALLQRQALEVLLSELWARRQHKLAEATTRAQLLCLADYLQGDQQLGRRIHALWSALSSAGHARELAVPRSRRAVIPIRDALGSQRPVRGNRTEEKRQKESVIRGMSLLAADRLWVCRTRER